MCYKFISNESKNITIINFYNKGNYIYDNFENDKEIINILENKDDMLVLAGDFNKGYGIDDKEEYIKFVEKYKKYELIDCVNNYSEKYIPTSYYTKTKKYYLNDFCFVKNCNGRILNENDEWENHNDNMLWKGLSDHRALIIEINI